MPGRTDANRFVVATIKPWNIANFERYFGDRPNWRLVTTPAALTLEFLGAFDPAHIFFPHWSWIVPTSIHDRFACVCFHMTDVPYGRGGSPLQNLILRGHKETCLSALRMVEDLDAGPVYMKRRLSLDGSAQDIFERTSGAAFEMIREIAAGTPDPVPQTGAPVRFQRRTPAQSALPEAGTLAAIYDHIRMLDAETYPHAFLDHGAFRLTFRDAHLQADSVTATVTIHRKDSGDE